MKKRTKGLVVLAAGAALTLPSGATLALWHRSEPLPESQVTTGVLDLEWSPALTEGADRITWTWQHDNDQGQRVTTALSMNAIAAGALQFSPGDVLTGTTYVDATLAGRNIIATLSYNREGLIAGNWVTAEDATVTLGAPGEATMAGEITGMRATRTRIPVTVEIEFPTRPTGVDEVSFDINALTVYLTQTRPATS